MTLTFRPRRPADERFLIEITLQMMRPVIQSSSHADLTEEIVKAQLDACTTVIVEENGKRIGYYSCSLYAPGRMYWGSLVLSPEGQGRGHGDRIVRHWLEETRRQGVCVIDGHVQVANARAIRFWRKHGFSFIGETYPGSYDIRKRLC